MGLKLHILFFGLTWILGQALAEEKFLNVKGIVKAENSETLLADYSIKIVQDRLDSTISLFSKPDFQVWVPANRRTTLYFIKTGYVTKSVYVDASYIPSIAFKTKQQIDLEIEMTPIDKVGRRDFSKPIFTAQYNASENQFNVAESEIATKSNVPDNYTPPFPAPVDTYKGVQPTDNSLTLTNIEQIKKTYSNELKSLIEGILFADMNYCFFNERTNEANLYLKKLVEVNPDNWSNIKPFDSPEYGKIIMRTLNREQGVDTLFALGANIECSRLIFENFTSDSKILVHLKKMKEVLNIYKPTVLDSKINSILSQLKSIVPTISDIEKKYQESLRTKTDFNLEQDELFISIKSINASVYSELIE